MTKWYNMKSSLYIIWRPWVIGICSLQRIYNIHPLQKAKENFFKIYTSWQEIASIAETWYGKVKRERKSTLANEKNKEKKGEIKREKKKRQALIGHTLCFVLWILIQFKYKIQTYGTWILMEIAYSVIYRREKFSSLCDLPLQFLLS